MRVRVRVGGKGGGKGGEDGMVVAVRSINDSVPCLSKAHRVCTDSRSELTDRSLPPKIRHLCLAQVACNKSARVELV